jgi:hypothetical protein
MLHALSVRAHTACMARTLTIDGQRAWERQRASVISCSPVASHRVYPRGRRGCRHLHKKRRSDRMWRVPDVYKYYAVWMSAKSIRCGDAMRVHGLQFMSPENREGTAEVCRRAVERAGV